VLKARFQTRCARCTEWITVGVQVQHAYGGYFHAACWYEYQRYRVALAASGKIER
jgi:hypothetical protein